MQVVRNLSRLRRLAAIVLALVLTPVAYAGVTCGGWSASAAERLACCARGDSGCATVSADDCCADAEQRQNAQTMAAVLVTPGVADSEPVPVAPPVPQSFVLDPRARAERPPIHLLDSVFLI